MLRFISIVFGVVFGSIFAGAGLYIALQTAVPLIQSYRIAQTWQPVPAEILRVGGDDSSTTAKYTYSFKGEKYQGDRVYLADFNDNIGGYHNDLQRMLKRALNQGKLVTIHLDPSNPGDAVLDREMRWGLFTLMVLFCTVFVAIGLGVIWASFYAKPLKRTSLLPGLLKLRKEWREQGGDDSFGSFLQKRREHLYKEDQKSSVEGGQGLRLNQDWKKRKGWESATIGSGAKRSTLFMWFFALAWNGISYGVLWPVFSDWNGQDWERLLVLLFPITGLFLVFTALRKTLELKRFGLVKYTMDPYPGAVGGNVGGLVKLADPEHSRDEFIVLLECVYSYMSGSGKNRSRNERIEWAEEGAAKTARLADGMELDFLFTVPEDLPEADTEQSGDYYLWRLTVKADLPGIDLDRSYNIPVFATGELSRGLHHNISEQVVKVKEREVARTESAIARGSFDTTALSHSMGIKKRDRGVLLVFPMFRNKILTLIALVFGGGFGFATYSIITGFSGAGLFGILAYLFAVPFGVVAFIGAVTGLYMSFNNLRVWIENRQVKVLRRLLFLPIYYKRVEKGEVTSLTTKRTGSTGQGVKKVEHYKVLAHLKDGGTMTLAEGVDGERLAEQFKKYLMGKIQNC